MLTGLNGSVSFFLFGGITFLVGGLGWYFRKPRRGKYMDYNSLQTANAPFITLFGLALIIFGILNCIFGFLV
jgi:hypothetical protein